jgi:mannose/fructose/N-acetylgalactosamine-specific phosphotransferase system component IID
MQPISLGVFTVLQDFDDMFLEEVPIGLPPLCVIKHKIDLIPGATLPNRVPYRTNPDEMKEIQQQVQALLDDIFMSLLALVLFLLFWCLRKMLHGACA